MPAEREIASWIATHDRPFAVIDEDYRIVGVNRAYELAYQVTAEEVIGRRCYQVTHHHSTPCCDHGEECPHQLVFDGQQLHECLHTHFDGGGHPRWVRVTGHRILSANGEIYLGEGVCEVAAQEPAAKEARRGPRMVGRAPAYVAMIERLGSAARTASPVLLQGETGTGKELAAAFIHQQSERRNRPFTCLDCTVLSDGLFESEVFGHERGSFTDAQTTRRGLFELAHGGTIFLDEIGEMPLSCQAKLLRVLETREFRRVGAEDTMKVDVRVVCATNRSLWASVQAGAFRRDLYYRIACFTIQMPPLRERLEDVPLLAEEILRRRHQPQHGEPSPTLSASALAVLQAYDYPGNVRELSNLLHVAATSADDGHVDAKDVRRAVAQFDTWKGFSEPAPEEEPFSQAAAGDPVPSPDAERSYIRELLHRYHGHRRRVAEALGMSERTLYRRLKQYKLE
ncbi:MAG: sigma 54-interacting transcriptional regulator [Nitrospirota bacterium]